MSKELKSHIWNSMRTAWQLDYGRNTLRKLIHATTENEVTRIMTTARHAM